MPAGGKRLLATSFASRAEASRRQLGLLWGVVSVALVVLATRAEQLAQAVPQCTFRALAGVPCPTCGVTRVTLALADLELMTALRINPLATVLWTALVVGGVIAGIAALRGRPLGEPNCNLSLVERFALVAVVLANWAYLVSRGI